MRSFSGTRGKQGFTLIELLVVIGITAVIGAVVFPNWQEVGRSLAVERSATLLVQEISRARELSLSGTQLPGGVSCSSGRLRGYGVHFEEGLGIATMFGECNEDNVLSVEDAQVGSIPFEQGITVDSLSSGSVLDVFFLPPKPDVIATGNAFPVSIRLRSESITRTITINERGVVEISP